MFQLIKFLLDYECKERIVLIGNNLLQSDTFLYISHYIYQHIIIYLVVINTFQFLWLCWDIPLQFQSHVLAKDLFTLDLGNISCVFQVLPSKSLLKTQYNPISCVPAIPLYTGLGCIWNMGKKCKGLENSIHGNTDARVNLQYK